MVPRALGREPRMLRTSRTFGTVRAEAVFRQTGSGAFRFIPFGFEGVCLKSQTASFRSGCWQTGSKPLSIFILCVSEGFCQTSPAELFGKRVRNCFGFIRGFPKAFANMASLWQTGSKWLRIYLRVSEGICLKGRGLHSIRPVFGSPSDPRLRDLPTLRILVLTSGGMRTENVVE